MSRFFRTKLAAAAVAASAVMAMGASAATIDFTGAPNGDQTNYEEDGYVFDEVRIVGGPCASTDCGAENDGEISTLTQIGGGSFSATSIWFYINGAGTDNVFTLTTDLGVKHFTQDDYAKNTGHVLNLGLYPDIFSGIEFLEISSLGQGNIRFDDIEVSDPDSGPKPVPLPATGLMLLGGLALMGAARQRRRQV